MAPHTGRYSNDASRRRTAAQWYCLLGGAALLLAGVLGFVANASFHTGDIPSGTVQGDPFLGFEINGWHNLVHLVSGLVLLAAGNTRPTAKLVALGFGIVYGLVTLIGLVDGSDVLGIIPINGQDNILHVALSALGIITGLLSPVRKGHGHAHNREATTTLDEPANGRFEREAGGARVDDPIPGDTPRQH